MDTGTMKCSLSAVCFITYFVLIHDNLKSASASPREHHVSIRAVDKYSTKYDNIDVDQILHSNRLLLNYVNCLLDKGPCSPEGKLLKEYLPDALSTDCSKCSEMQKKQAGKIFTVILKDHPDIWDQLIAKYDPDGNFRKKYQIDEDYDYSELDEA